VYTMTSMKASIKNPEQNYLKTPSKSNAPCHSGKRKQKQTTATTTIKNLCSSLHFDNMPHSQPSYIANNLTLRVFLQ
jgi:hypothetical protein